MVITNSFASLQKTVILKIIEMNNDQLIQFVQPNSINQSFIELQKNAIKKIYQMNTNELEMIIQGDVEYEDY